MKSDSFILSRASRMLLPLLLTLAAVAFYRGHHLPGGGFIGGLLAAAGFGLVALAEGADAARRALRCDPVTLMAVGLVTALAAATAGSAASVSPLAGLWLPAFHLPLVGKVHLGTPLLFDAGVLLTVMGFALKVIFALREEEA